VRGGALTHPLPLVEQLGAATQSAGSMSGFIALHVTTRAS